MKNLLMILTISLFSMASISANNIPEIRDYLKIHESSGDISAIGDDGASFGILQIQSKAIWDVNNEFGTQYTHQDAFIESCAEEIFELYIQIWTCNLKTKEKRPVTEYDIVRIWNGGPRGYKKRSTLGYLSKYKKIKNQNTMNKRKCRVGKKLGIITATYTHTVDVFIFKTRTTKYGVHKKYVKLLPLEAKKNKFQLALAFR